MIYVNKQNTYSLSGNTYEWATKHWILFSRIQLIQKIMKLKANSITLVVAIAIVSILTSCGSKTSNDQNWESLLDKDLEHWDKFVGVPHYSLELDGYEKGDGMEGTPLGLNNDPLNVFSTVVMDGETILKISGQIYGAVSTKKEYENYHLRMMYKWGPGRYAPRADKPRDSGILYHCQDPQGAFWNCWMQSQEFQVQNGDTGDYYTIAGTGMDIRARQVVKPGAKYDIYVYDSNGEYKRFKSGEDGRCRKNTNYEKAGVWNQLDLVCIGDKSYHIVNGKVAMILERSVVYNEDNVATPLTKGKIQIQSEGAEVYYKDIEIRSISELPDQFVGELY